MRHINLDNLAVGKAWETEAKKALTETRKKPTSERRKKYINKKAKIWSDLKPELEALSARKCWYCESYEKRSDRAVDHYRPKNNVRDCNHEGYWWLAFDYSNYRLCCTYCNSRRADRETEEVGGKGDYFPVNDEANRVCTEGLSFKYEQPILLDPCIASDVSLLWYYEDGRVMPKYDRKEKPLAYKRADKSIEYYHLNETEIKEARQALYLNIKEKIKDGDFHFEDAFGGNPNADHSLEKIMKELARLTRKESEFSAFAKAIIAGFRSLERPWMDAIYILE